MHTSNKIVIAQQLALGFYGFFTPVYLHWLIGIEASATWIVLNSIVSTASVMEFGITTMAQRERALQRSGGTAINLTLQGKKADFVSLVRLLQTYSIYACAASSVVIFFLVGFQENSARIQSAILLFFVISYAIIFYVSRLYLALLEGGGEWLYAKSIWTAYYVLSPMLCAATVTVAPSLTTFFIVSSVLLVLVTIAFGRKTDFRIEPAIPSLEDARNLLLTTAPYAGVNFSAIAITSVQLLILAPVLSEIELIFLYYCIRAHNFFSGVVGQVSVRYSLELSAKYSVERRDNEAHEVVYFRSAMKFFGQALLVATSGLFTGLVLLQFVADERLNGALLDRWPVVVLAIIATVLQNFGNILNNQVIARGKNPFMPISIMYACTYLASLALLGDQATLSTIFLAQICLTCAISIPYSLYKCKHR